MKKTFCYPEKNSAFLIKFIGLDITRQTKLLRKDGILADRDSEKGICVSLYYLHGFFVEETVSVKENKVIEIIPFKQGYKVEKYFEIKQVLALKIKSKKTPSRIESHK